MMCVSLTQFATQVVMFITSSGKLLFAVLVLFTRFSGHRAAQRECALTELRFHARCHPYPIP